MLALQHPDKHMHAETSRSVEESEARFAQLKQAFDLLSNDQSRQLFLRSGLGWRGPGGSAGGGFSSDDIPFDVRHNPWGQPRTSTRTRYGHQRGAYPSMHWDWSEADFYTPSYDKQGSDADKPLSNSIMFGMLGFGSLAFYFYNILVSVPENDPAKITASGGSGLKVMEDRHEKARMALVDARQAAKENAAERRLQIRGQAKLFGLDSGTTGHMPPPDMSMPVKQVSGPAAPASKGQPSQAALPPPPPSSPRDRQTSSPVE